MKIYHFEQRIKALRRTDPDATVTMVDGAIVVTFSRPGVKTHPSIAIMLQESGWHLSDDGAMWLGT